MAEDLRVFTRDESDIWDTRLKLFSSYFDEANQILLRISNYNDGVHRDVTQVQHILSKVKEHILDLVQTTKSSTEVNYLRSDQLDKEWSPLGEGNFGKVYYTKLSGAKVAVKVFKDKAKSIFRESNLLRFLSHEHIVSFRGIGYIRSSEISRFISKKDNGDCLSRDREQSDSSDKEEMFLVMEYVEQNLYHYVQSLDSYERHGLSAFHTWSIGQQIVSALDFLHRNGIAHRDLKPDNVLVEIGPNTIKAKVADFGLAWHAEQINIACTPAVKMSGLSSSSTRSSSSGVNIRWGPPEFFSESESDEVEKKDPAFRTLSFEDYKRGDVYCFGLVLAYTLTGQKPFDHLTTSTLEWWREQPLSPSYSFLSKLRGPLPDVIVTCIQDCPTNRPSIENLTDTFLLDASPYKNAADEAEFFSCGFLRKTNIFIADTCTTNIEAGCYQTGILPTGYDHRDLVCELDRTDFPYKFFPDTWGIEDDQKYLEFYQNFKEKAMKGEIENNPKAALKELIILREGDDEEQRLQLRFKETEYCHQQAMRFVWRSLTEEERNLTVPCKTEVSDYFSNTFGLQICVLTYEGDGNPQKFMFPQRANRTGIPTPGAYTGGAVEGASVLDYTPDGKYYDLVQTAVRGLKEELSIELSIEEREVICITTLYLAFDNYEWGMCGFLDLSDPRLSENNRVSAAVLQDRFVSGPKDKFEHSKVKFVPFALEDMVQFLYENHENVASYAKAAVVKVLQAYFGSKRVEQAFGQKFPKT